MQVIVFREEGNKLQALLQEWLGYIPDVKIHKMSQSETGTQVTLTIFYTGTMRRPEAAQG
ncbi:hypothetical protein JIN84_01610 [Luteolibacter yonseiensis]|uniref:Uncharacterized protein n=1 Tax=Luteolibacter yonseiensis TaxID=1144680 RepID=A0A934R059_9BACT|nr:hypothetical protein [Luteolibacter yonseiensis]MBK1814304.1 hypothetical protein [Luteolibacter yonseiensis]